MKYEEKLMKRKEDITRAIKSFTNGDMTFRDLISTLSKLRKSEQYYRSRWVRENSQLKKSMVASTIKERR